jgi:hypothetical protein
MSVKKALVIGCSLASFLAVVLLAVVVGWLIWIVQDVEGVAVSVDVPLDVKVGESFEMLVQVTNQRPAKDLTLSDIDIADEYIESFAVISTDPPSKSVTHIPLDNSMSHTFDLTIPPGETQVFTFHLRAEKPGFYRGDVDVCEGTRFITATAQTVVKE